MNRSSFVEKYVLPLFLSFSFLISTSFPSIAAQKESSTAKVLKVEIISPKEGERVHGNIIIEARVNDPEAVKYCEFYVQEPGAKDRYGWKDYDPPYFWGGEGQTLDTAMFDDGRASAVIFCFPQNSQSAMFQDRIHFLIDNGKPTVQILSPKDSSFVKGNVVIHFSAYDTEERHKTAGITAVYLYIDGDLFQRLENPPFEAEWDTCFLQPGLHSIRAIVEDTEGFLSSHNVIVSIVE